MIDIEEILNTESKREGWRMLLEDTAWFCDCSEGVDFDEWSEGRDLAIRAHAAGKWARWQEETAHRNPSIPELSNLFRLPLDATASILAEVALYVGPVDNADLSNVVQAYAYDRPETVTVGMAATALLMPIDLIAALVPEVGGENAMFCFRENTDRPLAEQTFGFDGE